MGQLLGWRMCEIYGGGLPFLVPSKTFLLVGNTAHRDELRRICQWSHSHMLGFVTMKVYKALLASATVDKNKILF